MLADSTSSTISVTLSTLSTGFNILMRLVRITACLSDVHGPLGQVQVVKTIHAIGDEAGAAETLRNYADLLRQTGRDAEADEWQARADAIREMRAEEIN